MDDFSTKNKYIELLELFSLKQCVKIPTRITGTSKTVIDHVITNIENKSELCTRVLEQGVWGETRLSHFDLSQRLLCQSLYVKNIFVKNFYVKNITVRNF